MKRICALVLFAFGFLFASAQQVNKNYSILFKSGVVQLQPNADAFSTNDDLNQFPVFNQRIYALLQFNNVPTIEQRQAIEASGIHLLDYIPHFSFYASLPSDFDPSILASLNVSSLSEIKTNYKLNQELRNNSIPQHAIKQEGTVDVNVLHFNDVSINSEQTNGLHYNGSGVHVAVADGGSISHIDFKGRWTDHTNTAQGGTHGDMTSGICVGAGNLDPTITGMATGAHLHEFSISGYPQIVDAISNYNIDSIVLVSTSYSQGCMTIRNLNLYSVQVIIIVPIVVTEQGINGVILPVDINQEKM